MTLTSVATSWLPSSAARLETPTLLVDRTRLTGNLHRMQAHATAHGVELRPHAKTHKSLAVGAAQLAAGACGLSVATLAEAERFAAGGCDDLFIAYPLWAGGERGVRLRALHDRIRLRVGVDSLDAATALRDATRGAAEPPAVMVEVDSGQHRTGVAPPAAAELALGCARLGLDVVGVFSHPGHVYADPSVVAAVVAEEAQSLTAAAVSVAAALRPDRPLVVSGGSTPTVSAAIPDGLTEVRPGTYVFGDRQQMHLAGIDPATIALVVAARVVSRARPGEMVLDAGSKALSTDRPAWLDGFGWLPQYPEAAVTALTEEHAVVTGVIDPPPVGEVVAVVPNHVCTAVNLASELLVCADGDVVDRWPVDARR